VTDQLTNEKVRQPGRLERSAETGSVGPFCLAEVGQIWGASKGSCGQLRAI